MPSDGSRSAQVQTPLARRVLPEAQAEQIADAVVAIWQEVDAALAPIVGKRGLAALYARSLHLASPAHPWLAALSDGAQTPPDLAALKSALAQQGSASAAAGSNELLHQFHQLLASLIGHSLTERLLRSAWADTAVAPASQDTTT